MVYRAIGIMSGSSLDGLDVVFTEFEEGAGQWQWKIKQADTLPYNQEWQSRLREAIHLNAREYMLLHTDYGHYTGKAVLEFIEKTACSTRCS